MTPPHLAETSNGPRSRAHLLVGVPLGALLSLLAGWAASSIYELAEFGRADPPTLTGLLFSFKVAAMFVIPIVAGEIAAWNRARGARAAFALAITALHGMLLLSLHVSAGSFAEAVRPRRLDQALRFVSANPELVIYELLSVSCAAGLLVWIRSPPKRVGLRWQLTAALSFPAVAALLVALGPLWTIYPGMVPPLTRAPVPLKFCAWSLGPMLRAAAAVLGLEVARHVISRLRGDADPQGSAAPA